MRLVVMANAGETDKLEISRRQCIDDICDDNTSDMAINSSNHQYDVESTSGYSNSDYSDFFDDFGNHFSMVAVTSDDSCSAVADTHMQQKRARMSFEEACAVVANNNDSMECEEEDWKEDISEDDTDKDWEMLGYENWVPDGNYLPTGHKLLTKNEVPEYSNNDSKPSAVNISYDDDLVPTPRSHPSESPSEDPRYAPFDPSDRPTGDHDTEPNAGPYNTETKYAKEIEGFSGS